MDVCITGLRFLEGRILIIKYLYLLEWWKHHKKKMTEKKWVGKKEGRKNDMERILDIACLQDHFYFILFFVYQIPPPLPPPTGPLPHLPQSTILHS